MMKTRVFLFAAYAAAALLLCLLVALPSWSQTTSTTTLSADRIAKLLATDHAMFTALPAPPDDPLLDSSGHVVLDANGNPESDPNEGFHRVTPQDFDPGHTFLVEAGWLDGLGCVTSGFTATPNADFSAWSGNTAPYSEPACPTGDMKDKKNEGLLLVKTGPSGANFASAEASLKKVRGITLKELGYDIRKAGGVISALGSHCGAGAPRFDIQTTDGSFFFLACDSPPPTTESSPPISMGLLDPWDRVRWGNGTAGSVMGYCVPPSPACPMMFALLPITETVERIDIVFDEGTDTGPDFFGAAILDNIDVNGTLVGHSVDEGE